MKGGEIMTVSTQLQGAIASVESAAASIKTFALETQDQSAKQMFQDCANTLETVATQLKGRQQYIEQQEPQYKQI